MEGTKEILEGLKEFSRDASWISAEQETLRKKFASQYIAVIKHKVIDSDPNLQNLLRKLRENGKDPGDIPVEFISKEPVRLIL